MKVKRDIIKLCSVFCLLLSVCVMHSQYCNEMLQVFHNKQKVNVSKHSQESDYDNLELGNVVFYFAQKPIVNFVPERNIHDVKNSTKVFIFPKAILKNSSCFSSVKKVNDSFGLGYSLKIEKITVPIEGLKLSITYDSDRVEINYKTFESIANEQGVIFNFYNKQLINKIKNKEDNVLCIV